MDIVIAPTAEEIAVIAADAIERVLVTRGVPMLGLATGSSPLPTYRELIRRGEQGTMSFADAHCFLLDEYVGLPPDHHESYRSFIHREFTDLVDLPADRIVGPDGNADDLLAEAERYEQLLAADGGVDIQLLGIGADGHIGFNEPMSSLGSRTRVKTLTLETRTSNARFFGGDVDAVPHHAITQGIGTILDARHLILIATGEAKAEPVARAVEGPLTASHPASALQLHPHVTVLVDEAAAGAFRHADYYREVLASKPDWQHL